MRSSCAGWVLLNYPVVTSRGRDNAGGFDHLLGNLQVYQRLGFKVLCICRWSPRLVDRLEGAWVLNIVPGVAVPSTSSIYFSNNTVDVRRVQLFKKVMLKLRDVSLTLVGSVLQYIFRPKILHERANLRFALKPCGQNPLHLIELNDEFIPPSRCDAYLTVQRRSTLGLPQFVWCWPVPVVARFDAKRFLECLARIAKPVRRLNILLFGIGGTSTPEIVRDFIATHPWFRSSIFDLHIYGGIAQNRAIKCVVQHSWCDARQLPVQNYDAAVLFYDDKVYDDERLSLGSPTKLWKYVDWSLPVFCNRPYISQQFLGLFDTSDEVLRNHEHASNFAEHLQMLRNQTKPETYAQELATFLKGSIKEH